MFVGILQFELIVHGSESLKDKRRVVKSVKDRLHREHMVSIAEVAALDHQRLAVMGLALVSNSTRHVHRTFDGIVHKLRALHDAELGETMRQVLSGAEVGYSADPETEAGPNPEDPGGEPSMESES